MKTLTRNLIGVGTAAAVFATSFAVAGAVSNSPEPFAVDAPLTIPASTVEQAPVLLPVAYGDEADDLDPTTLELSEFDGTASVVVVDGDNGPGDDGPGGDDDAEGAGLSPELIRAAAALDASGGDASGSPRPSEEPAPSPTSDPMLDPASDPCAALGEASEDAEDPATDEAACPEGVHATVFALTDGEDLEVWASADPPTGPYMGSTVYCADAGLPDGVLSLGAVTNDPSAVTVTYWPVTDPGSTQTITLPQVETFTDGYARHCGATEPLSEGMYEATAIAINADGLISMPWSFSFDSRGAPTTPAMRLQPLGSNWLWVGVYHTRYETADIKGFDLTGGTTPTCAEAANHSVRGVRQDIVAHTSPITSDWLRARNFNSAFTRVTSVLLYVPGGTSVGVCGYTFTSEEPSFDIDVPERMQFATAEAPDVWEGVATLRSITVFREGYVFVGARSHTGGSCGTEFETAVNPSEEGSLTTISSGQELCRVAGQNMQLRVDTTYRAETGEVEDGRSGARVVLLGSSCTGSCPEPEAQTYTISLPGLGEDECPDRVTDDCDVRRRVRGGHAIVDLTWERAGAGSRAEWGLGSAADQVDTTMRPDSAQFDYFASFSTTLSTDGFSATGITTLKWDRDVDYTVHVVGTCFGGTEGADPTEPRAGAVTPAGSGTYSAVVTVDSLCPGHDYSLVVTYTDDAGNVKVAAPPGVPGVTPEYLWFGGQATTDQRYLSITAKVEIRKNDRVEASYLVRDSIINVGGTDLYPSFGTPQTERCFADARVGSDAHTRAVPLQRTYDVTPQINVFTDWGWWPVSPECIWRNTDRWIPPANVTVTLAQLLAGAEFGGPMVRRDFPDDERSFDPFTYRVTLRATYLEE